MASDSKLREQLEKRWETDPIYVEVKKRLIEENQGKLKKSLTPLVDERLRNEEGFIDLRGFNFNWSDPRKPSQPHYWDGEFSRLDFSYSKSTSCWIFHSIFSNCKFTNGDFHDMLFGGDFFECNFDNTALTCCGLGVSSKYFKSSFVGMEVRGNEFHFGSFSVYQQCIFKNVKIKSLSWSDSAVFEDCQFSGIISHSDFTTKRILRQWRWSSVANLFKKRKFPSRFIRCDMSEFVCDHVDFGDAEFLECELSDSIVEALKPE